jgi:ABC-2 type transport system permease protein
MNRALLAFVWRSQRLKLIAVSVALALFGMVLVIVYAAFGRDLRAVLESGLIPPTILELTRQLSGGGDIFSLAGSVALGVVHPISVALVGVFAVGFGAAAVAGERERGTLEVLLARPIHRRAVYLTFLVALAGFVALAVAAQLLGILVAAAVTGVASELDVATLPVLWLNDTLLFVALGTIGLAASVASDRLAPAMGVTLAVTLIGYVVEFLGSVWPDARGLQPFSPFHYLRPNEILGGHPRPGDLVVLATVAAVAIGVALAVFPRRDLAAPT